MTQLLSNKKTSDNNSTAMPVEMSVNSLGTQYSKIAGGQGKWSDVNSSTELLHKMRIKEALC